MTTVSSEALVLIVELEYAGTSWQEWVLKKWTEMRLGKGALGSLMHVVN